MVAAMFFLEMKSAKLSCLKITSVPVRDLACMVSPSKQRPRRSALYREPLRGFNQYILIYEGNLVLTDHLLEIIQLGSSNDGGSDLLCTPGKRDLSHLDALLFGELLDTGGRCSINNFGWYW